MPIAKCHPYYGHEKPVTAASSRYASIIAQTIHSTQAGDQETIESDAPVEYLVQRKWFIKAQEGDIR